MKAVPIYLQQQVSSVTCNIASKIISMIVQLLSCSVIPTSTYMGLHMEMDSPHHCQNLISVIVTDTPIHLPYFSALPGHPLIEWNWRLFWHFIFLLVNFT
jgi:hypothetical protein